MHILISGSYNAFADGFNGAGVYMASGLFQSATFERPIYIGSTTDLKRRITRNHLPELANNEHANKPLQNAYNAHGGHNAFVWYLLESCEPAETLAREQAWLDAEIPFCDLLKGYNIQRDAKGGGTGRIVSEETRRKQSLALKGRKRTPEQCKRISEAHKGRITSPETKAKLAVASAKRKGWKHTEETKQKIREARLNR